MLKKEKYTEPKVELFTFDKGDVVTTNSSIVEMQEATLGGGEAEFMSVWLDY